MTKDYIGNCITSFDEDGECIVDQLPWCDASEFACELEEAETIEKFEIHDVVATYMGESLSYMKCGDVFIAYNDETDIHYFFI